MKHEEKRFYHKGQKVFDRQNVFDGQTSSHGHNPQFEDNVMCEARSRHAAEQIERALNAREGQMQPIREKRGEISFKTRRKVLGQVEEAIKAVPPQLSAGRMRQAALIAVRRVRDDNTTDK